MNSCGCPKLGEDEPLPYGRNWEIFQGGSVDIFTAEDVGDWGAKMTEVRKGCMVLRDACKGDPGGLPQTVEYWELSGEEYICKASGLFQSGRDIRIADMISAMTSAS